MLTSVAMNGLTACLAGRIASAQFESGGTWYEAGMTANVAATGYKVTVTVTIDGETAQGETVTAVRLKDANGDVMAENETTILRETNDGVLYRFDFTLIESEA